MPCTCAVPAPDTVDVTTCTKCFKPIVAAASASASASTSSSAPQLSDKKDKKDQKEDGAWIVGLPRPVKSYGILGHGIYRSVDGLFTVPHGVRVIFYLPHEGKMISWAEGAGIRNVEAGTRTSATAVFEAGERCYNYRIGPGYGETLGIDEGAASIVGVNAWDMAKKFFIVGRHALWVELSTIAEAVGRGVPDGQVVDLHWIACREVIESDHRLWRLNMAGFEYTPNAPDDGAIPECNRKPLASWRWGRVDIMPAGDGS